MQSVMPSSVVYSQSQNGVNGQSRFKSYQSQSLLCWTCGLPGHISRNCPRKGQVNTENPSCTDTANRSMRKRKKNLRILDESYVYITLRLRSKLVPCLLDSGCEATMVPRSLLNCRQVKNMKPTTRKVYAANDTPIQVEGEIRLPLLLYKQCIWVNALVSEDIDEVMLGVDFLEQNECIWNFKAGEVSINGYPAVALSRRGSYKCQRVLATEYMEIPPRSQRDVIARVKLSKARERYSKDTIVESNQLKPGLYVGRTLLQRRHRNIRVCVANTSAKPQVITPGSHLGTAVSVRAVVREENPVLDDSDCTKPSETASIGQSFSEIVEPTLQKLTTDITYEQRQQIVEFLQEYDDMFSKGMHDMGRTKLVEHSIDTGQNRPIREPLRRHPYAHLAEIDRQVNGLLENGFIEPAASPWASNVVLVRKRMGRIECVSTTDS